MLKEFRPALAVLIGLTLITGLIYPLAITGVAQVAFPAQANGSLIERNGAVVGSALIGQMFAEDKYFHGRPSATTAPDPKDPSKTVEAPYNAANSGGSNMGPTSKVLAERLKGDIDTRKQENPQADDPDISPAAAYFQAPRVAKARGLPELRLRDLIDSQIRGRIFGLLGEPHVNVLELNLALDKLRS
jgi:K+-transporting ATPase ATPase C chain